MPKAYSEDLRWRAVWLTVVRDVSSAEIANMLFTCEKSVHRYLALFHTMGCVSPKEHNSGPERTLSRLKCCKH